VASSTVSTNDITNTIASWNTLSSSITAAAGKVVTLTLSTPFDMTGFQSAPSIDMQTAKTAITIVGNGAVLDAGRNNTANRFFVVGSSVALVMSNVTLQNGYTVNDHYGGGAINVFGGGTVTLSDCSFIGNSAAPGHGGYGPSVGGAISVSGTITLCDCSFIDNNCAGPGGAIHVDGAGTVTLSDCSFSGNTRGTAASMSGGALYFSAHSNGLLKNCSLLGTVSLGKNDIARTDTTANVTFACADGEVGTPVQTSCTEITKIPALTCL
jgi:predicted outer membrane repeat protein